MSVCCKPDVSRRCPRLHRLEGEGSGLGDCGERTVSVKKAMKWRALSFIIVGICMLVRPRYAHPSNRKRKPPDRATVSSALAHFGESVISHWQTVLVCAYSWHSVYQAIYHREELDIAKQCSLACQPNCKAQRMLSLFTVLGYGVGMLYSLSLTKLNDAASASSVWFILAERPSLSNLTSTLQTNTAATALNYSITAQPPTITSGLENKLARSNRMLAFS